MASAPEVENVEPAEKAGPAATHSIKGFEQDLTCRGFQYAVGQTYAHQGAVEACSGGFHACTVDAHPLSVFDYYAPAGSVFHEVTQGGEQHSDDGIKIASATITIGLEISLGELVKRAWDYVWARAVKSDEAHVTIDQGAASATGTRGAALASGYGGRVSGDEGNALFAVERDDELQIVSVAAGIVGLDGITSGRWYACKGGKLVEAA